MREREREMAEGQLSVLRRDSKHYIPHAILRVTRGNKSESWYPFLSPHSPNYYVLTYVRT
jgi:hypothetical protein